MTRSRRRRRRRTQHVKHRSWPIERSTTGHVVCTNARMLLRFLALVDVRRSDVSVPRDGAEQGRQTSKATAEHGQRDGHALVVVVLALILQAAPFAYPRLARLVDDGAEEKCAGQVAERFRHRRFETEREGTMRRLNAVQHAFQCRHDHAARHEHGDERTAECDQQIDRAFTFFASTCRARRFRSKLANGKRDSPTDTVLLFRRHRQSAYSPLRIFLQPRRHGFW